MIAAVSSSRRARVRTVGGALLCLGLMILGFRWLFGGREG